MNRESQNIEWKPGWRDEYLKWVCGFANAQGGTLVIGKDDTGNIVHQQDIRKLLEDIPNQSRDILGLMVDVNLQNEAGQDFLKIVVEPYPFPISLKGKYYYRSGSTLQELKGTALTKFLLERQGKKWDGIPVRNVGVANLKNETIDFFRKKAERSKRLGPDDLQGSNQELLDRLHLFVEDEQILKRAAILLFHPNPEKFITGTFVKIGFFETDDDLRFQDEVHGNLFEQIEKTMDLLLTKYLKAEISYEGISRVERYNYPEEALREALLNAIAHKDYSGGTPIQISVYDDKIIIWNEGQLPENWTVKNLLEKHASKPYNPDVANTLFRCGYIESWGRGTIKIIKECKKAGIPEPVFSYIANDIYVEFRKDIYNDRNLHLLGLNQRQIKAIFYIKEKGKVTNRDYQALNEIGRETATRDLKELIEKEILKPSGRKGAGAFYTLR